VGNERFHRTRFTRATGVKISDTCAHLCNQSILSFERGSNGLATNHTHVACT
jgi:hypothetical protein